jgi:predicted acetyltransferase
MSELEIGAPREERDLTRFAAVVVQALGFPAAHAPEWLARVGHDNVRLARRQGDVLGGYAVAPTGLWLGERAVRAAGITAVAVLPEHRSGGVGSALMRASLPELHAAGYPLAALYPATYPVYRRVGYETAGTRTTYRVWLANLNAHDRMLHVRAAKEADHPTLHMLYDERARRTAGNLARSPFLWWRALAGREPPHAYLVEGDAGPEGYVSFTQRESGSVFPRYELHVRDFVALTPGAGRTILRLLADHRSMARHAIVPAAPREPVFLLAPEEPIEIVDQLRFMVRIIDVEAALRARGYPATVTGEVTFELRDDLLAHNESCFTMAVESGKAEVRRAATRTARLVLDIRGLAALYTGYLSPEELRATGLVDGPPEDLAALGAIFAGPSPWMAEIF